MLMPALYTGLDSSVGSELDERVYGLNTALKRTIIQEDVSRALSLSFLHTLPHPPVLLFSSPVFLLSCPLSLIPLSLPPPFPLYLPSAPVFFLLCHFLPTVLPIPLLLLPSSGEEPGFFGSSRSPTILILTSLLLRLNK